MLNKVDLLTYLLTYLLAITYLVIAQNILEMKAKVNHFIQILYRRNRFLPLKFSKIKKES